LVGNERLKYLGKYKQCVSRNAVCVSCCSVSEGV